MYGIGKNILALESKDEILVIDCGIMFPDSDMYGIDKVIPDFSYLEKNKHKIKGIVVTHGHEDHIGAIAFFLEKINVPVYGTRLSLGLVEHKLMEKQITGYKLITIDESSKVNFHFFKLSFIRVSHSIPDGVMTIIDTPKGTIVHSGDFKIDYTPIDNKAMDLSRIAEIGKKGVLLFMSDSTNAIKNGHTLSERQVGESFERYFKTIKGRILLATFSSNIHRIQQAIDVATKFNRKICFAGISMENTAKIAKRLGYLSYDDNDLIFIGDVDKYPDDRMLILTTGSQGEPLSALTRISNDNYRLYQIRPSDTVVISALPIPGNEKMVYSTIDKLGRKGVRVIYEEASKLHVSGHAYAEELKLMLMLIKPKFFIPAHGEYRHLSAHADLARDLGVTEDILIAENGDVIDLSGRTLHIIDKIKLRDIYVDSNEVCLEDETLLDERRTMANDGVVVFTFYINQNGDMLEDVNVLSKGVTPVQEDFIKGLKDSLMDRYNNMLSNGKIEKATLTKDLEEIVRKYMNKKIGKSPCIIPIVIYK